VKHQRGMSSRKRSSSIPPTVAARVTLGESNKFSNLEKAPGGNCRKLEWLIVAVGKKSEFQSRRTRSRFRSRAGGIEPKEKGIRTGKREGSGLSTWGTVVTTFEQTTQDSPSGAEETIRWGGFIHRQLVAVAGENRSLGQNMQKKGKELKPERSGKTPSPRVITLDGKRTGGSPAHSGLGVVRRKRKRPTVVWTVSGQTSTFRVKTRVRNLRGKNH